ncbi:MAG: T9SS type A sorting domain-containing protein [Ferruginibacter sp.]
MNTKILRLFSIALIGMAFLPVQKAISQTVLTNPASPWTVPAGVSQIKVEVWGGGGAGGGVNSVFGTAFGSGGGGGAYNTGVLNVSAGQNYTITVGAGGTAASDANGTAGTASSVSGPGGSVTANPGTGGGRRGGTAGTGGTGTFNGGAGGLATSQGAGGGGGGGNAGAGNAGSNSAAGTGGTGNPNGAPYIGGTGGGIRGGTSGNTGLPGAAPGGGGGGAYSILFSGAKAGGAGGAGQVVITYCPTYSLTSMSAVTPRCETNANSTITLNGNLPVGSYTVTYNRSSPAATGLTASMTVSTANTGTFVAAGLTVVGNTTITVTSIGSTTSTFCTNSIISNNTAVVVISGAATVGAGGDQTVCTAVDVTLAGSIGGTATSATWSGGTGTFNPGNTALNAIYTPSAAEITAGSAALTLTTNNPAGACPAVSDAMTINIKKAPTAISITPSSSTICIGNNQALTAAATINSTPSLSSENFNTAGSFTYTAAGTNSGGGTAFSQQSSGYVAGITTITNNDASRFMIAVTANFGAASTNSTLTSPVINTTAYSSLNLSFRHTYQKGDEAGVSVQVSTNGGSSWSNISTAGATIATNTFTANQGANNNFVTQGINLSSFINNANFRIRFNYVANVALIGNNWWAIDDVLINGVPLPLFSWAASTGAGINGLPAGAGTLSASNKNITVNPTATTTYTVTAVDAATSCGLSTITATVNVNQNSTISLSSPAGTNSQTICMPGSITDITYAVGGGGTGASITAGALPAGLTASYSAGVFTITGTPTEFGNFNYTVTTTGLCVNPSLSGTLTVNTAPALTCPANQVTTTDPGVCLASRSYDLAIATGFPAPTVSYLVDGNFISFPYDFPLGTTTVQVLAEGACAPDADCSFTVTVNDEEGPTPDLGVLPDATGECSVTVTDVPTATDACDGAIIGTTTDLLTYNTQGTFTITWSFTDLKGNTTTQDQTVIVNDITPPDITCPPTLTTCSVPGNNFTITPAVASDNCTISSVAYEVTGATTRSGTGTDASGLFNPGISTITWTVTDGNNNTNTCSSTVNIQSPLLVPTVTGIQNVCPYLGTGEQLTYTAFAFGANSYTWTLPPNVNTVSGLGTNTITLTFNNTFAAQNNKQLRVTATNTCGTSPLGVYYLLTQFPNTPNPIAGPTNICNLIGTENTASYSVSPVTAATGYAWSIPAGVDTTHPNPAGSINDTVINVKFNNSFTGGTISVIATNGCGISGTRSISIQRTPSSTPGLINGPTNACANILPGGTAATYSVAPVSGAASYTWITPPGSVVTHPNGAGPNDYTITVQFPSGFTSGNISVSSTNGCGTSGTRSLAITKLNPATPSVVDVIQVGFCGDPGGRVYTYTLAAMPANATSVQWTVPTSQGAALVSGQGSTSITVSYPSTAVQGSVTAQSFSNCGSSTIRNSAVKLPACPSGFSKTNENNTGKNGHALPVVITAFDAQVYPNPTVSDFRLKVLTPVNEKITVRILDMQGRELKSVLVMPYQTINIGADLKAGTYLAEIKQGDNITIKKIQKF